MQTILGDLRYAVRQLWHARTFTIVTILTLALGVGANTAIFSVIQAVLLQPAGVRDPASVASFHARYTQLNLPSIGVLNARFRRCRIVELAGGFWRARTARAVSTRPSMSGRGICGQDR